MWWSVQSEHARAYARWEASVALLKEPYGLAVSYGVVADDVGRRPDDGRSACVMRLSLNKNDLAMFRRQLTAHTTIFGMQVAKQSPLVISIGSRRRLFKECEFMIIEPDAKWLLLARNLLSLN